MEELTIEDNFDGKVIRCVFNFSRYNEKDFAEDFKEFLGFQRARKPRGKFVDYHLYNIAKFEDIPYKYFRDYSARFFSIAMFHVVRQIPDLIFSDALSIHLYFRRVKNWKYSFETIDELTDQRNASFKAAGIWFLNNLVAPFFYLKRFEFKVIVRYFLHELTHYVDIINKNLNWDVNRNYEKRVKSLVGRKSAYGINYIYNSLFNLREEGLADFIARSTSPEINLSGNAIREYNKNLAKLAFMRHKKEASDFYFDNISYSNPTLTGEYSIGRNMCLIIAMALSKSLQLPFSIRIGNEKYTGYDFENLDTWLSGEKTLHIKGLKKKVVYEAIKVIRPVRYYSFLKLYETSCDSLGMSDKNRAMTKKRFSALVKEAKSLNDDLEQSELSRFMVTE